MRAWETVGAGGTNPLVDNLAGDRELARFLSGGEIHELMDYTRHLGNAPAKAREMAARVRIEIGD
jgi:hypothetical protein